MFVLEEELKSFGIYMLPGLVTLVPYWVIWPVKRGWADILCAVIALPMAAHGFAHIFGSLLTPFFGSSLMFGAWGREALTLWLSIGGFIIGAWYGYACSKRGPDFYPSPYIDLR